MKKYVSFEYAPCAVEAKNENTGEVYIQVVLKECAEFYGVYGRVKDETTGHLLAEHIVDVIRAEEAEELVNLLNYLNTKKG